METLITEDVDHPRSLSSVDIQQMETIELETETERLQRQVDELTEQLNKSQSAEKHAHDERDQYIQMYHRLKDRFLAFEEKQLDQIRRILNNLISDRSETLSENPDNSSQTFTNDQSLDIIIDHQKTESNWNDVLAQIGTIMEISEKFTAKYSELIEENNQKHEENMKLHFDLSSLQTDYEKEQQTRQEIEDELTEATKLIEMDRSKRLQKLRNYASLADDEGDILLSSLMKKAEKNDIDFRELKHQYETNVLQQTEHIKKLVKEREILHLYIRRLENENTSLAGRTTSDETIQFLTSSSQVPTTYEEALNLIKQLRDEIVQQIKIQDKLHNDIQQLLSNHQNDMRERERIEELLHRDLQSAKDHILILESVRSEYEHVLKLKVHLEKELEEYTNELIQTKTATNSLIEHLKERMEETSLEKERLEEENAALRIQVQNFKVDYQNSESVQHDFVKLSQTLQVQLEELRNSDNQLRWQAEEDFTDCQKCHTQFSVTWRKHHCRHCGKVLCKECLSKIVHSGPNHRPGRVCDVCYTLLNKNSQPYFLTGVPKV